MWPKLSILHGKKLNKSITKVRNKTLLTKYKRLSDFTYMNFDGMRKFRHYFAIRYFIEVVFRRKANFFVNLDFYFPLYKYSTSDNKRIFASVHSIFIWVWAYDKETK